MKLGIFLRVSLVKLQKNGNALHAEATTQEIKHQHLHGNNPSSSVARLRVCQATLCTMRRLDNTMPR